MRIILLAALSIALVGCSGGEEEAVRPPAASATTTPTSPAPDLVEWADQVCTATRLFTKKPAVPELTAGGPDVSPGVEGELRLGQMVQMAAYLEDIEDIAVASDDLLKKLKPVDGTADMVAGYRAALARLIPEAKKQRTMVMDDSVPGRVQKVAGLVTALKTDGPALADVQAARPELLAAHNVAPNCGPRGMFPRPGQGVPTPPSR